MNKKLLSLLLVICLSFALVTGVFATQDISGTYSATACTMDNVDYSCVDEYVVVNSDGTGVVSFGGVEYAMQWTQSGNSFSFTDSEGSEFTGTLVNGVMSGTYEGYSYEYTIDGVSDVFVQTQAASSTEYAGTYEAVSCTSEGSNYQCSGEYVVLNDNGTGTVVYNGESYTLNWSITEDGSFNAVDNMGNTMAGILQGTDLVVEFHSYSYIFTNSGSSAPSMKLSPENWGQGLPYVFDQAGLLTEEEFNELTLMAQTVSDVHLCNVYIIIVDDYNNYTNAEYIETCAEEIRTGYNLGYGDSHDTIMLLLSMDNRAYDICAYGDLANAAFTDFGKDYMADEFTDDFGNDDWYTGLVDYINCCDDFLTDNENGEPFDAAYIGNDPIVKFIGSFAIAILISYFFCRAQKNKMKNVSDAEEASDYIPTDGVEITNRKDRYTHTTETRVYDPPSKGSGGGTSVGGSGSSHSSGSF